MDSKLLTIIDTAETEPQAPEYASLAGMVAARQLSPADAEAYARVAPKALSGEPDETAVLRWLAGEYGLEYSELEDAEPDRQLLSLFPARVLLKHALLPWRRVAPGDERDAETIEIATSALFATEGLDTLRVMTGRTLRPLLASSAAIQRELKRSLGVGADTLDSMTEEASIQVIDEDESGNVDLDEAAADASIIRFVNQVLGDAIALRATDIHIEPFEKELRIRYRIDGVLQEIAVPPQIKRYQPAIVSRVKILSHLDIAEKRLPQDGRIKVRLERSEVDVRVSLIPMIHGEAVVMRLLQQEAMLRGLRELRMNERDDRLFRSMLLIPHGIILVTGPTGSGKTTTLYSALSEINDLERKIITIEDPVEYHLRGVNQIQVSEKAGLTFARGLRSILRHDPDVVLVGEIRDSETAQIAVQASLTGHLVFSTLHTNDAPGAITRLVDMGVEPYLVASALEGVLAQRLVRMLCPACKHEDSGAATRVIKREMGLGDAVRVFAAGACEACRQTGFHGRRGIFELMPIDDEIRELMLSSKSSGVLREAALRAGMSSLADDGWRVIAEGQTTIDEVLRVTKRDRRGNGNGNGHGISSTSTSTSTIKNI